MQYISFGFSTPRESWKNYTNWNKSSYLWNKIDGILDATGWWTCKMIYFPSFINSLDFSFQGSPTKTTREKKVRFNFQNKTLNLPMVLC